MKKITLFFILCFTFVYWSYSQCTNQVFQWPQSIVSIVAAPGPQTIATNNWPQNEFSVIDGLVIGESYTVTATPSAYITVTEDDRITVITHGAGSVSFVATTTRIACFWTADAICTNGPSTNTLTQINCTTCICDTTAPLAAINPVPANSATGVEIIYDDADLLIAFDWEDNAVGGEGQSYTFSLGETVTGDDIGSLSVSNSQVLLNYTWAEGTQYYWKVETINCAGSATSSVWSFTTSSCSSVAPGTITSVQSPANMATGVEIDNTDPENLSITFDWDEALTGDPATNYIVSLGTTATGDDIGTVSTLDGESTIDINFAWEYETTYYWFVTAQNCGGTSSASAVFSFTTEAELSVDDFNRNSLTHFYDSNNQALTMQSSNAAFESIVMYNLLGQQVISKNLSQTTEVINMSSLKNGIYLAKVTLDGRTQTIKIIKN